MGVGGKSYLPESSFNTFTLSQWVRSNTQWSQDIVKYCCRVGIVESGSCGSNTQRRVILNERAGW